jgi:hypothetical protein
VALADGDQAGEEARRERERMRSYGWLVGFLFIAGSLTAIPALIIVDANSLMYPVIALGVVFGLLCWRVPWERLPRESLHVTAFIGIVEVSVALALADGDAAFFFLYATVLSAYAFRRRWEVALQLAIVVVAVFLPLLYVDDGSEVVQHAMFALPAILVVSGLVRYLTETLEDRERTFHRFAEETLTIAERMRDRPPPRGLLVPERRSVSRG